MAKKITKKKVKDAKQELVKVLATKNTTKEPLKKEEYKVSEDELQKAFKAISLSTRNDFNSKKLLKEVFVQIGGGLDKLIELINKDQFNPKGFDKEFVRKVKEDLKK